jgi:hypothetical protein
MSSPDIGESGERERETGKRELLSLSRHSLSGPFSLRERMARKKENGRFSVEAGVSARDYI